MKKKFYKKSNISGIGRLFIGSGVAMGSLLIFAVILGGVAMLFEDVAAKIPTFAIITIIVSAIVGGAVVSRTVSEGKTSLSLLSSLMAALIFMLIGAIIGGGALPFSVFLNFIIFVGTFTLSAYLTRKRERFGGGRFIK
jgi:hypothetical protein